MIKRIKSSFLFVALCACIALCFAALPCGAENAHAAEEMLISDFTGKSDPVRGDADMIDGESFAQWNNKNFADWFGGSSYFPDLMSITSKHDVEGALDGNAVKVGFIGYSYTNAAGFKFDFGKSIDYENVAKITFRVYLHIDTSGLSEIKLYSLNGKTCYTFTTAIQDEWIDVEVMNEDLINLFDNGKFSGINVIVSFASVRNGNYIDNYSDYWGKTFLADPSYMYFDRVTYTPYEKTTKFTFDYNKDISGIDPTTVTVRSGKIARPADPYVLGYKFLGWYNADYTERFDFSSKLDSDKTVYAKFEKISLPDGVITDFDVNSVELGYAHLTRESYIEWKNYNMRTVGTDTVPASSTEFYTDLEGAEDGKALKINFMGFQYTTAVGLSMEFPDAVPASDIGKIVLRTFMHVDTDGCSVIKLYSADGMSHFDFTTENSDEWVDIEIKGADLKKILTESTFKKLNFILVFGNVRNGNYEDAYSDYWGRWFYADPSYMYLDSITYRGLREVTLNIDGKTEKIMTIDGDPLTIGATPEKSGQIFTGWTKDGEPYDIETPVTENIALTATFAPEISDYSSVYGVYANGDDRVILNSDKTAFIVEDGKYREYDFSVSETGVLIMSAQGNFVFDGIENGKVLHGGEEYLSVAKANVTYKWLDEERTVSVKDGDAALNLKLRVKYYVFNGWKTESGDDYDFTAAAVDGDVLVADIRLDEVEDYTDYLGSYYYASGNSLIVLKENNDAEILVGKDKKQLKYYLIKGEIAIFADNGVITEFEYTAQSLRTEAGRHRRLKKYFVGFVVGEKRTSVEVESGYYKVARPADPVKEGETFLGWYDEDTNKLYDFDSVVSSSMTLKAVFSGDAPAEDSQSMTGDSEELAQGGCGGSIGGGVTAALAVAMIFVVRKRKE